MRKQNNFYTEEQKEVFKFVKILLGLVVIVAIMYFFTNSVVNKNAVYKRTNNKGEIQYNRIIVGSILNQSDKEYYVFLYDSKVSENIILYNKVLEYNSNANHIPVYIIDLNNEFNKSYLKDKSNYSKDSLDDFSVKGTTLLKVKNKSIVKFIEEKETIIETLN